MSSSRGGTSSSVTSEWSGDSKGGKASRTSVLESSTFSVATGSHSRSGSTTFLSDVTGDVSSLRSSEFFKSGELARPSITASLAPKARKGNDLSDFTIDKLKISSLGLHGRDKELQQLQESLKKLLSSSSSTGSSSGTTTAAAASAAGERLGLLKQEHRQLILISGYSGTGKTALARMAFQKTTEQLGGLYVRGKFDLNLRSQPYSGMNAACAEICSAILELQTRDPGRAEQLCRQLKTELGSELALILQVIPILAEVIPLDVAEDSPSRSTTTTTSTQGQSPDSKNQFNFAFLRFVRVITYQFTPLIFVLDDLQWADGASLDLLDVLLTDSSTSKLVVVGIYRSNEVDETHIFHRTMTDLAVKSRDQYFEMTQLEIGNLDFNAVHEIIQELLALDNDSRTLGLAELCHTKTHGNVFFLLQFMLMLKERQLLHFNFGTVSWSWDIKEIEASTSASDNVVDLLKAKMANLDQHLIDILKLASCLGSNFDLGTLNIVWEQSMQLSLTDNLALMSSIEALEEEGYFLKSASKATQHTYSYSWVHDKIQEAALSLVPNAERGAFAAKVGRILLSYLDEKDLDSAIFVVVNLLNGVDEKLIKHDEARLDLARMNCSACQKAISFSAFESAASYAAIGIRLLPENAWVDHYDLTLKIYTLGASAESFIGNTETMELYCNQVLSQVDRPIEDKIEIYHIRTTSLLHRDLTNEARDLSLDILQRFKCRFPKKNSALVVLGIIKNVIRIKSTMKTRDVSTLEIMRDSTRLELMKILDRLGNVFYILKDDRMPLSVFASLNWTMKYGYCEFSSVAFASTGVILTGALNDLQGGAKYGEQAMMLMERSKSQATVARTLFLVNSFVFNWTKLLRNLLKPLLQSYDIGLQTG
jgi:predicted ATPase